MSKYTNSNSGVEFEVPVYANRGKLSQRRITSQYEFCYDVTLSANYLGIVNQSPCIVWFLFGKRIFAQYIAKNFTRKLTQLL